MVTMTRPDVEPGEARRLDRATADLDPPFAVVDLDALDANAGDLLRRGGRGPRRAAGEGVRGRAVLRRVLALPGYAGILGYTLREALWLAGGEDPVSTDVVVAYPTADRTALHRLVADEAAATRITLMVDSAEQLEFVDAVVP